MKGLSEYILEYVKSGKSRSSRFMELTIEGIAEWLEDLGFERLEHTPLKSTDFSRKFKIYNLEESADTEIVGQFMYNGYRYRIDIRFGGSFITLINLIEIVSFPNRTTIVLSARNEKDYPDALCKIDEIAKEK